mgnify:CR=1 FL=1
MCIRLCVVRVYERTLPQALLPNVFSKSRLNVSTCEPCNIFNEASTLLTSVSITSPQFLNHGWRKSSNIVFLKVFFFFRKVECVTFFFFFLEADDVGVSY